MALFIMKWMDSSLKECRMQGLSFLRASPVEVRRSMALFIMKWMDSSLKECRMQGLSFLRASPLFGSCVGRTRPQDPVLAPRASASEIKLDAIIGGGLEEGDLSILRFISASLGFRELDSSRDFCVACAIETLGCGGLVWIVVQSRCFYGLEITEKPLIMTPSFHFFDEKFSSFVLSKPLASSVLNGTSVLVNEFDIVIVIEELEDRNEMECHQLEILLGYVRNGREQLPSNT
ncbi:hypothetical protein F2Q70_00009835 [Brassica cretica]|uniref:Uncharacterized protein n=1 Tax=Brassica cretica TaxID=69181 RepID=A0A8S9LTJ9_BRACR|nr:hypothetical protein F2Q70_00009835 [Brassica cretica]